MLIKRYEKTYLSGIVILHFFSCLFTRATSFNHRADEELFLQNNFQLIAEKMNMRFHLPVVRFYCFVVVAARANTDKNFVLIIF